MIKDKNPPGGIDRAFAVGPLNDSPNITESLRADGFFAATGLWLYSVMPSPASMLAADDRGPRYARTAA